MCELMQTHRRFKDTFDALPYPVMKADACRYLYMHQFGGAPCKPVQSQEERVVFPRSSLACSACPAAGPDRYKQQTRGHLAHWAPPGAACAAPHALIAAAAPGAS